MDRRQETGLWQVYKERYREREEDAVEEPYDEESHPNDQQDNVNRLPRLIFVLNIPHSPLTNKHLPSCINYNRAEKL